MATCPDPASLCHIVDASLPDQINPNIDKTLASIDMGRAPFIVICDEVTLNGDYTITKDIYFADCGMINLNGYKLTINGRIHGRKQQHFRNGIPYINMESEIWLDWFFETAIQDNNAAPKVNILIKRLGHGPNQEVNIYSQRELPLGTRISVERDNVNLIGLACVCVPDPNDNSGNNWTHGGIRIRGDYQWHPTVLTIAAPANAGDTQIYMGITGASLLVPNTFARIRGQNTADGIAMWFEDIQILSYDPITRLAQLAQPLEYSYLPVYPGSAYQGPNGTDITTVTIKLTRLVTDKPIENDTIINVADTSIYQVGDPVVLESEVFYDKLYQYKPPVKNSLPIFAFHTFIEEIIDGTRVRIAHQLPSDFPLDENGSTHYTQVTNPTLRLSRLKLIKNSHIKNCSIRYEADNERLTNNSFQLVLTQQCTMQDCYVDGTGGQKGHAFSLRQSIHSGALRCEAWKPKYGDAGEGYGFSFYSTTDCYVEEGQTTRCRHALLFFRNACYNTVRNCYFNDTAISDIDFHGGNCNRNLIDGITVNKGESACNADGFTTIYDTNDVYYKSVVKFGNPKHVHGDYKNVVRNVVAHGYINKYVIQAVNNGEFVPMTNLYLDPNTGQVNKNGTGIALNVPFESAVENMQAEDDNVVEDCVFNNFMIGVYLSYTNYLVNPLDYGQFTVRNCTFRNCYAFWVYWDVPTAFSVDLIGNNIEGCYQGVYTDANTIPNTSYVNLHKNRFTYVTYPMFVDTNAAIIRTYGNIDYEVIGNVFPYYRIMKATKSGAQLVRHGANAVPSLPILTNTAGTVSQAGLTW